jgi:predicted DNA-binding transcriptional regulator AlpA
MHNLELLTIDEFARILKISPATIDNWVYGRKKAPAGFPPAIDLVSNRRWRSSDIQQFIADLPFRKTGKIPTPPRPCQNAINNEPLLPLDRPIRGRGRPRKIPIQTTRLSPDSSHFSNAN